MVLTISRELQALSAARLDAENKLAATRQARDALAQELEDANQTVAEIDQEVRECALAIIAPEAERLGEKMIKHEARAIALRRRLLAYGSAGETLQ